MSVRTLFAALIGVALFVMGAHETLDPDMWWHLRTGELVWNGQFPRVDPFSFTRAGVDWIAHEWLSDAVMWGLFQAGGVAALILFFAAVGALAYWLIYLRCPGRPYLAGFVVVLAALASAPFWGVRPQMFNILFMAFFICTVEGVRDDGRSRRLLLLPLAMVVWANLHSGYLLGVVLLGTIWVGEEIESRRPRPSDRTIDAPGRRHLLLATGGALLAALLNPHGYRLWIYPFLTLGSPAMQRFIAEWRSPDFHLPHFWLFAALLGLGVVAWAYGRVADDRFQLRRTSETPQRGVSTISSVSAVDGTQDVGGPSVTELLLFLGTAAAGLLSARHIPLFTLVAAPIVSRHLLRALAGTAVYPILSGAAAPAAVTPLLRRVNVATLLLVIVAAAVWTGQRIGNNDAVIEALYPVTAVDEMARQGWDDVPIFNEYAWGGYLIWRGLPVYVDGRADVYGDDFLFTYLQTAGLSPDWAEPLDRYAIETVLIGRDAPLAALLDADAGWEGVYADEVARIFRRVGE